MDLTGILATTLMAGVTLSVYDQLFREKKQKEAKKVI